MALKSFIPYKDFPINKQLIYELSAMGGSAECILTFAEDDRARKIFHFKCTAGIKLLNIQYHFECISRWEDDQSVLTFDRYEEKDFSKDIHKKWELNAEGLNYLEDKKGLVVEREVVYFTDKEISNILDPLSAVVQFTLNPLLPGETRDIHIFGKQRAQELKAENKGDHIAILPIQGMNAIWTKMLSQAKLKFKNNFLYSVEIPSPLQFGTLKLNLKTVRDITKEEVAPLVSAFKS